MNRKLMTAEELLHRYEKEIKTIRILRWVTLAIYLYLLWVLRHAMGMMMAVLSAMMFVLALRMLQSMQTQQFQMLQYVLNQDCDALKYTKIMERLAEKAGKDQMPLRLYQAKGLYYSGEFAACRRVLDSAYMERPSAGVALLYRINSFNCALDEGDLEKGREEREEAFKLLNAVPPKNRGLINKQLLLMDAALAYEENRFDDFFPLQTQALREAEAPIQKMTALYRLALGELVQSEPAALEHLREVIELGGTLYMAESARDLLEEYSLPE